MDVIYWIWFINSYLSSSDNILPSCNVGSFILISTRQNDSMAMWHWYGSQSLTNNYLWCRWMHTTLFLSWECPAYWVLKISPTDLECALLLYITLLVRSEVLWAVHLMVYITEKEFRSWASHYLLNNIFTTTLTLSTNNNIVNFFVPIKLLVWWILAGKSHVEQIALKRLSLKITQIID